MIRSVAARRVTRRRRAARDGVSLRGVGVPSGEHGESAITAIFGVGIFLGFLLLATQVILYLFTATVVQAAAVDGANHGAGAAQTDSVRAAELRAVEVLGGFASGADIDGRIVPDSAGAVLELRIRVTAPAIVAAGLGLATVEREATARIEG